MQLGRTDQRIAGNIAGLVAAGKTGLEIAAEYAETVGGAGEIFTLAVTAFAQGLAVEFTLAAGLGSPPGRKGLSGALAWTEPRVIEPQVRHWLESREEGLRLLGLVALSHHRSDPGAMLAGFLADPAPEVRSRAARLAFELGRVDLAGHLSDLADGDVWPLLGLARFGKGAGPLYDHAAMAEAPLAALALDAALIAAPDQARERLGAMLRLPATRALAMSRAGVTGDLSVTGWLWQQLDQEADVESAQYALFDLYPLDPDLCSDLAQQPLSVEAWLKAHANDPPHLSLRRKRLDVLRAGFRDRAAPLPDWRRARAYPAWS
ncbi:MAG: hypothetical protein FD152_185 [Xanthobacteraceae bacterium]|nr:MAG: hypothetical protein FD152_185 [Xanthobacteraceae bacterium]